MCLCAGAVSDLLSGQPERRYKSKILCVFKFVRSGGILLRFLFAGEYQNRLLHDCGTGVFAADGSGGVKESFAEAAMQVGSYRGILSLFCSAVTENVRGGLKTFALFKLDF